MTLLLRTVTGSRLYGLDHEDSDWDWMEVHGWDKFKPKQNIRDGDDRVRASYDSFMRYCEKGVPQYLEVMFSRKAEFDNMPFDRMHYRPGMTKVRDTYRRTVKSFWVSGIEEDSFKKRRHAARLFVNLNTMEQYGKFDPTLGKVEKNFCNLVAHSKDGRHLELGA